MFTYYLEMTCIVAFALSGVMIESNRGKDIISILLIGWITALGGGTLRDMIINADQVFWIRDQTYFWVALAGSLVGFFLIHELRKSKVEKMIVFFDTLGVSLFAVLVTANLYSTGYAAYVAVMMGMITAVFGGVLRDILSHRENIFNTTDIYASIVILGSSIYIALINFGVSYGIASVSCVIFTVALRLYILVNKIRYPSFFILK